MSRAIHFSLLGGVVFTHHRANEQSSMADALEAGMQGRDDQQRPEQAQRAARKKWTTNPAEGVDLLIGEAGLEAEAPLTVGRMFKDTAERLPDHPAHMYKENGEWKTITYKQHYDRCFAAAKSFLKVSYTLRICAVKRTFCCL